MSFKHPKYQNNKIKHQQKTCFMITDLNGYIGFVQGDNIFSCKRQKLSGKHFFNDLLTQQSKQIILEKFNGQILPQYQNSIGFECHTHLSNSKKFKKERQRLNGVIIQQLIINCSRIYISFEEQPVIKRQTKVTFIDSEQFIKTQNMHQFIFLQIHQGKTKFKKDIINYKNLLSMKNFERSANTSGIYLKNVSLQIEEQQSLQSESNSQYGEKTVKKDYKNDKMQEDEDQGYSFNSKDK